MRIFKVKNKHLSQQFNSFPRKLYRDDNEFISHIDQDVEAVFDPKENSQFEEGKASRWLCIRGGFVVGRIAAFYNVSNDIAGIGFFDCVNDLEVAKYLFDTAEDWLKEKGVNRVEAPINFGERDKYWGLLVQGFKRPSYQENYNYPYYQSLFEQLGYEKMLEQTTSEIAIGDAKLERFVTRANQLQSSGYEIEHFRFEDIAKYVKAFVSVYNQAWQQHDHFSALTEERVSEMFDQMRPILREDLIWFTFYQGEPVAFYVSVIDVNQIFKHLNGRLDWIGKIKFLWFKKAVKIDRIRGIVFGVIPEYQNKGIYAGMIAKMGEVCTNDPHILSSELSWIGDFNPKMHALFNRLGAIKTKVHFTYEKHL